MIESKSMPSTPTDIQTVGVIGAGVMGAGVAQALAGNALQVILVDVSNAILEAAIGRVRSALQVAALTSKRPAARTDDVLARIQLTTDIRQAKAADFVIENVDERWPTKCDIYRELDAVCRDGVVFAANTSTFPIADIARLTQRPESIVGVHFMNPAAVRPMVEVIPSRYTTEETLARVHALLKLMGKAGVIVRDRPGFVTNRVLMLTINEAIRVVEEGTADASDVDRLFSGCFGHPMGPLATADLIGLDTILLSLESLRQRLGDSKFEPAPLLRKMVAAGQLGRKNGVGFHPYRMGAHS